MSSRLSQSTSKLSRLATSPFGTPLRHTFPRSTILSNEIISRTFTQRASYSISSKIKDTLNPEAMDTIKQTVAQNFGIGGAHELVPESQRFDLNDTPDLKGKVAVVTGGSEGIGFGAVYTMLKFGLEKVFILSLSKDVMDESLKRIKDDLGEETAKKVTWLECDLTDWKKVKQTADHIAKSTDRIDILNNNAARGIMTYQLTDYGVDRHVSMHPSSVLDTLTRPIDGDEPYGPRHPDLAPSPHPQEDRFKWQHRPYLQHVFQRTSRGTL